MYSLAPMAIAALTLAVPLRRRGAPELFALLAIADLRLDEPRCVCNRPARDDLVGTNVRVIAPDWLDRSHLGPARYLALPYANTFYGTYLESWNRDLRGVVLLDTQPPDPFPAAVASVARDGTLQIDGKPAKAQTSDREHAGTTIGLEGTIVVRHPRDGLVAYRIPAGAHVRWLAAGLAPDGWTAPACAFEPGRSRTWPLRPERSTSRPGRRRARSPSASAPSPPRRHPAANRRADRGRTTRDVRRRAEHHRSAAVSSV